MNKSRKEKINKSSVVCLLLALSFTPFGQVLAQELKEDITEGLDPKEDIEEEKVEDKFNPGNIITDKEMLDHKAMTKQDIQNFLEEQGSFLADYETDDAHGEVRSAAEIIYNATNKNCGNINLQNATWVERRVSCQEIPTINPQALLALLQKEMSLISDPNPSDRQLNWAAGYGCPDGGVCSPRWEGFGKQVNSAALQFRYYMDNPNHYNFKEGETYEFDNPYSEKEKTNVVTIENTATAALYNYTPHVYDGNYNFFLIWEKYFKKKEGGQTGLYPEGSLLQVEGQPGVWLIQDGKKRPFHNMTALRSRFDPDRIIKIKDEDILSPYNTGAPISLANYSIVKSPQGDKYLLVDDVKRPFASSEVFAKIGYNPQEVVEADQETLDSYKTGETITEDSAYPTGALLQNRETGGIYWAYAGERYPLVDRVFLDTKFRNETITPVSRQKIEEYQRVDPVKFDSGKLLTTPNSPAVYLVVENELRAFISGEIFEGLGYKWENVISVPERVIDLYEKGELIKEK